MARHGFGTALLDEIVIPLTEGDFAGKLGYVHPAAGQYRGPGYGLNDDSTLPLGASTHELPPEFEYRRVVATLKGQYFGSHEGLHVVGFGFVRLSIRHVGMPIVRFDVRGLELGEPLVRLVGRGSALAIVAVLEQTTRQPAPASLELWRDLVRAGVANPAFPNLSQVERVVDSLELRWTKGHAVIEEAIAFSGPLPASILGTLVLGDKQLAQDAARLVISNPEGIRGILAGRFPPAYTSDWQAGMAIACVALGLVRSDGSGQDGIPDPRLFGVSATELRDLMASEAVPCLRILGWTTEEALAEIVGRQMMRSPRSGPGEGNAEDARAAFALSHRDLGESDAAEATWREVRANWLKDLPSGRVSRGDRPWQGWVMHGLAGLLAVLWASWLRRRPNWRLGSLNEGLVLLAIAGILFVDSLHILVLATPFLGWIAWNQGARATHSNAWEQVVRTAVLISVVEAALLVLGLHDGRTIAVEAATTAQGITWLVLACWFFRPTPTRDSRTPSTLRL